MTETNNISIELSKAKLTKLLVFSIIFFSVGLWMIVSNPQTNNSFFNDPLVKGFASYGAVIMGALGTFFFTKKLFDKKPGLIIDEHGIYENTSAFAFGLIPWSDIAYIEEHILQVSVASKQYFVTVALTDPEKYISREKNLLKRKLLNANARSYGSPIHISTNGLKTTHQELLQLLKNALTKYRRHQAEQST
ncbi:MAG: hypothetical protein JWQ27_86 [Ferruginibacter sp.]|nr:hypothetical protein [Ferruginibacter sp.]